MNNDNIDFITYAHEHWDELTPEEQAEVTKLLVIPSVEIERYTKDPVAFAIEVLKFPINKYQERILRALVKYRRVCVRGPHAMGKSAISAVAILWFTVCHSECKVLTTASVWRQLTLFLWPEVHKWALRSEVEWWRVGIQIRPEKELFKTELKLGSNQFAVALSSTDEAKIEGAHSEYIMYVFDESKIIPAPIWDAAEGALASANAYALAVSTPGDSVGRFYDIQSRKKGYEDWHVIHVTLEDAVEAGRIDPAWAEQRKRTWGEKSVLYQRRVLGNFFDDDTETVITLSSIERAQQRWYELEDQVRKLINEEGLSPVKAELQVWGKQDRLGCDPARFGNDKTGYAHRFNTYYIKSVERTEKQSTMQTAGKIKKTLDQDHTITAFVDVNGLGAGTVDRLLEEKCNVVAIQGSNKTSLRDETGFYQFYSYRDWLWWNMRDILEKEDSKIALPPDEELSQDLVSAKFTTMSNGKIKICDKDEMRKTIGRSPDTGEAVIFVFGKDKPPYKPLIDFI